MEISSSLPGKPGRRKGTTQPQCLRLLPSDDPEEVKITYAAAYTGLSLAYLRKHIPAIQSGSALVVRTAEVNSHLVSLFKSSDQPK